MNVFVIVVTVYNLELMYFTSFSAPRDFLYPNFVFIFRLC